MKIEIEGKYDEEFSLCKSNFPKINSQLLSFCCATFSSFLSLSCVHRQFEYFFFWSEQKRKTFNNCAKSFPFSSSIPENFCSFRFFCYFYLNFSSAICTHSVKIYIAISAFSYPFQVHFRSCLLHRGKMNVMSLLLDILALCGRKKIKFFGRNSKKSISTFKFLFSFVFLLWL